jgi:hypothetical protein
VVKQLQRRQVVAKGRQHQIQVVLLREPVPASTLTAIALII